MSRDSGPQRHCDRMNAYRCTNCEFWHLGHKPKECER